MTATSPILNHPPRTRTEAALSLCCTALRMIARGSTDQDARDTADAALVKAGELVKEDVR